MEILCFAFNPGSDLTLAGRFLQFYRPDLLHAPEPFGSQLTLQDSVETIPGPQAPPRTAAEATRPDSEPQTIHARDKYRMGEHDTKADAVRMVIFIIQ